MDTLVERQGRHQRRNLTQEAIERDRRRIGRWIAEGKLIVTRDSVAPAPH